jgi:hypothetical protein
MTDLLELTVTMLGDQASGKTTYLVATHGSLVAGDGTYALRSLDHNQGLLLTEQWRKLLAGDYPKGTVASTEYNFELDRGLTPVARINWLDYRGGYVSQHAGQAADDEVNLLRARLADSDCILLTLDGEKVGQWIRDVAEQTKPDLNVARRQDELGITHLSPLFMEAAGLRKARVGHPQSVVILLTKYDLLLAAAAAAHITPPNAFAQAVAAVQELFWVGFSPGILTLVARTKVGDVTAEGHHIIRPEGFRDPLLFGLRCLLQELHARETVMLDGLRRERAWLAAELRSRPSVELADDGRRCAAEIEASQERREDWRTRAIAIDPDIAALTVFSGGDQILPRRQP